MKVVVKTASGDEVVHEYGEDDTVVAEPNQHGDLVVYRNHPHMMSAQTVASYAAGQWVSHTTGA